MNIYFSVTAYQSGFGCAQFKAVCGQTKEERQAVKEGKTVIFDCGRLSGGGNKTGTTLPQITYSKGYWRPRVPAKEVISEYVKGNYSYV